MFDEITPLQWKWYFYQYMRDRKEEFDRDVELSEYLASFTSPEAVEKVRQARKNSLKISSKQFDKNIERMFGRKLNAPSRPVDKIQTANMQKIIQNFKEGESKKEKIQKPIYKDMIDFDLEK